MAYLAPPTLTRTEKDVLLRASFAHPRDHLILSLALGTGLRSAEFVELSVSDVILPEALIPKLGRFWGYKR